MPSGNLKDEYNMIKINHVDLSFFQNYKLSFIIIIIIINKLKRAKNITKTFRNKQTKKKNCL